MCVNRWANGTHWARSQRGTNVVPGVGGFATTFFRFFPPTYSVVLYMFTLGASISCDRALGPSGAVATRQLMDHYDEVTCVVDRQTRGIGEVCLHPTFLQFFVFFFFISTMSK